MGEKQSEHSDLDKIGGDPNNGDDVKKMKLTKIMDNGWKEYQTNEGRKLYYHEETKKTSWKPPRKVQFSNEPVSVVGSSVGTVLKEGTLKIARLTRSRTEKRKKWIKCLVALTNTHLIFRKKKKLDYQSGCLPLASANIKEERFATKKSNSYQLSTRKENILFRKQDPVASESWYQAILIVIENISTGTKIGRVESFTRRESSPCFNFQRILDDITEGKVIFNVNGSETDSLIPEITNLNFKFPTPPGWTARYDENKKMFVYEQQDNGELWGAASRKDGSIYFYNIETAKESLLLPTKPKLETAV